MLERGDAAIDEGGGDVGGDRIHHGGRDENAAGLRQAFETGGDDERLAEGKLILEKHFAEMHANAQFERVKLRRFRQSGLDAQGASHSVHRTLEQREDAIAGHSEEPPSVVCELLGRDPAGGPERVERIGLVNAYEPAEVGDVGRENGPQPASTRRDAARGAGVGNAWGDRFRASDAPVGRACARNAFGGAVRESHRGCSPILEPVR